MLHLWFLIIGASVSIVTVAGNGIVVYLIITQRRLHNPANWIVLSLAFADLSVGAGTLLTLHLYEVFVIKFNERYCVVSLLEAASATNLCLLTFDRYIFIAKPLRYVALMTTRRAVLMIFSVWMAAFLSHFLYYLICIQLTSSEDSNCTRNFASFDFVVFETLPMVILAFAVGRILYIVRQRSRETAIQMTQLHFNQRNEEGRENAAQKERNSALKIVGISVTVFTMCSVCELIYTILYQFTGKEAPRNLEYANTLLYLVNSAINPVAYALFKSDIKKTLRSMFCCNGATPE